MARLLDRFLPTKPEARSLDWFTYDGSQYPLFGFGSPVQLTQSGEQVVQPDQTLESIARQILHAHGPIAALVFIRQLVFSSIEFKFQGLSDRRLFGGPQLSPLEEPWQGGTTQNLLAKTSVDADMVGNCYWRKVDGEMDRMRPDWVEIVLGKRPDGSLRKVGYRYWPRGPNGGSDPLPLLPSDVVHFMPLQDPLNPWRGMSWITPVIREVMVDQAATTHQQRFMENSATPNLAVTLPELTPDQVADFKERTDDAHQGAANAWKTMYLGGGADVKVVGVDLSKLDLKAVQGGLETRLAAAAGVPPAVVGFREGLSGSSLNAGNYGQARRRFADGTLHPLWREAAGSFAKVVQVPDGSRLWFDTRHVPFLREDAKDEAEIVQIQSAALRQLLDGGFKADAAVEFVQSADVARLRGQHSGKLSVQLLNTDGTDQESDEDSGGSE